MKNHHTKKNCVHLFHKSINYDVNIPTFIYLPYYINILYFID